ncbi:peptidoglycan recognition protein 1-like [Schistocerca serialis cubense]|uniref:peptidoglycan recognition protein 1-like n=1 Tax=Schistocerca serialis cubense TaxID=2023355 RepID=UPI00214F40B1|nr:peptidoglycan recognition protein 1-like [Schistocerca serialis cubense]
MARRLNEEDPGDDNTTPARAAAVLPPPPHPASAGLHQSAAPPTLIVALLPTPSSLCLDPEAEEPAANTLASTTLPQTSYAAAVSELATSPSASATPAPDKNVSPPPATRRRGILTSRYLVFGFLAFGVLVLIGSLVFTILSSKEAAPDPADEWSVVPRGDWGARPSTGAVPARSPAQYVVVGHAGTARCATRPQCLPLVRELQALHLRRGYSDVAYNFLVGGDGAVYEGRGWRVESPLAPAGLRPSLSLGLLGAASSPPPPAAQLAAARRLIRVGVDSGYVAANYTLLAESLTDGDELVRELSTWPHWPAGS